MPAGSGWPNAIYNVSQNIRPPKVLHTHYTHQYSSQAKVLQIGNGRADGSITKGRLRGDVVEAGLNHSSRRRFIWFTLQRLMWLINNVLWRTFYACSFCIVTTTVLFHVYFAINIRILKFQRWLLFHVSCLAKKNALRGWLMKIFIHQHKLVVYYNSQICDEN